MKAKRDKTGKFKPGTSGNPRGRPKGAGNKEAQFLRDKVRDLLDDNFDTIVDDLKALEPKDRVSAYIKMMDFALPKLKSIEAKASHEVVQPPQIIIGD